VCYLYNVNPKLLISKKEVANIKTQIVSSPTENNINNMAVLSKIRERSMFLIIIIGLALFAFVLDPSTLGDFLTLVK
jgi:hypothetical protein